MLRQNLRLSFSVWTFGTLGFRDIKSESLVFIHDWHSGRPTASDRHVGSEKPLNQMVLGNSLINRFWEIQSSVHSNSQKF